ncbi:MAG: transporter substrate-binding domain-containing protein, partial [Bryobacteraceae bacterium]|nr:transporter substrate-binding domain-containing protein [Bryobacteraceae bacterium]
MPKFSPAFIGLLAASVVVCIVVALQRPTAVNRDLVYKIGIDEAPPLLQFNKDGSAGGFAADILTEAARRRKIRLQWVPTNRSSPDKALGSGLVDLWPVLAATSERKRNFHLSKPWISNTFSLVSRKQNPAHGSGDLVGKVVAFGGFPVATVLAKRLMPKSVLQPQSSRDEILKAVCLETADAGFDEASHVHWLLLNRPAECKDVNLEAVLIPSAVSEGAIGSTKAAAAAADAIREEIYELARDGTMSASLDRWASLSASETRSVLSMQASGREKQMLAWALGAVVLLAGCIVWQVRRT